MRGTWITKENGQWKIPEDPKICFIEGDGIGPEVWSATQRTIDAAVEKSYHGVRKIYWEEVLAGEKAIEKCSEILPKETLAQLIQSRISIKGPLTTPIGGGFRSINVTLRQELNLYSCVRPVRYYSGVPSPVREPEKVDIVIFRENMEDIYTGIEWQSNTKDAKDVIEFFNQTMKENIPLEAGIGIKYITREGTRRIMQAAMKYAVENNRRVVTIVHKGNIMKYTEGSFKEWAYELAKEKFADQIIFEEEVPADGKVPAGKIVVNDRIADNMFQQLLLRPSEYEIICAPNLNGDYLSDALAAQVGGLGMAPGANIGDDTAVFEATHGSAPKAAGKNRANPGSLILSAVMMLRFMEWQEAADLIEQSLEKVILSRRVTGDLARQIEGATQVGTKEFADCIISEMESFGNDRGRD